MRICRIGNFEVGGDAPVRLMGIINCSPESFFSGSYVPVGNIYEEACRFMDAGADMIDLGARSTAPNSRVITEAEEIERLNAALNELSGSGIPVSVDTMYPQVLAECIKHDIDCINDIHGLCNTDYAKIAADSGLPAILMATYSIPGDPAGFDSVMGALEIVLERAELFGIDNIILDPAIGKWTPERTVEDDWELCRRFDEFAEFERPLLAAVSRKTFIGKLLDKEPEDRLFGTLAVTYDILKKGASIVRAHDVAATRDLIDVFEKVERRG